MHGSDQPAGRLPPLAISMSADGYVRLRPIQICGFQWIHLISGLDEQLNEEPVGTEAATHSPIAGYTEWATMTIPALSLGWDWRLEVPEGSVSYRRIGEPRSNIMLMDRYQRDLGDVQSAAVLVLFIDELPWEQAASHYVRTRYA